MDTSSKLQARDQAARLTREVREAGGRVVFTNGCFDLLHAGHVTYLEEARGLGDFLAVGLNSDASVQSLAKGPERPLVPEDQRARVLAALAAVDLVVIFDEPTPLALIEALAPDILVKGGDWPVEAIVGADFVRARGGLVASLPQVPGLSTTALAEKIRGSA
ncbi:MAG: D-glycero-beta-D-manno-heptose 1-phosphate adenylyltransferase [Deltaproteobacteria bacterium]|nr:D-glycero-beta-D-manno-heptose 1-phosphate adenylyltransferase [Deltaproteobacteria bacterium]